MPQFGSHDATGFSASGVEPGEWMGYVTSKADKVPSGRGISFAGTIALVVAALGSGAAAWIGDFDPVAWFSDSVSPKDTNTSSFDDRFSVASGPYLLSTDIPPRSLVRSLPSELETKFQQAQGRLAQKLQSLDWRVALIEEPASVEATSEEPTVDEPTVEKPAPSSVAAVPLPRSRPAEANLELQAGPSTAQSDNRTLLQKLSDLLPGRVTLASLAPDGGLFREGPDLASLGYDNVTAVYDISARAVYMPGGSKLEAHSGFGSLMDDPEHVSERNVGATPPNAYDLKPRERLFHGVQALRMIPVGDNGTTGRSGLLAHSYMLGPKGDSNGCVSIKDYEKFLKAFTNGEIRRLVVVPSLSNEKSASRRSTSQS
jgi:type VI secretion system (T6SS) effector TldE1-like protein